MRIMAMNITRCFLAVGFVCAVIMNTKAQTEPEGSHTLTVSAGTQLLNDDLLSLSSKKLTSSALIYSFANYNAYRKKSIVAGFERGVGNSDRNLSGSIEFTLQYINAFSILKNKTGRWNNYTGYAIIINPQYIKSGDQYSWATLNSLSLYNSLVYSWKESSVSFDLSMPLLGFGSRPAENTAYKGTVSDMLYNSFSKLTFTSLHNLKAVNVSIQYRKAITERLHFVAGASYNYKELSIRNSFLEQAYRLHAGLSYRLK